MSLIRLMFTRQLFAPEKLNLFRRCSSQNVFNLSDPTIQTYLRMLMFEHDHLYRRSQRTPEESRRLFEIQPIIRVLDQRITLHENIETLKDLKKKQTSDDEEMNDMIKEEAKIYLKRLTEVDHELETVLLEPRLSEGGVLLEVTAGAGGQEAMLFARELFEMYQTYAEYKDWVVCLISVEKSDLGGIRKASMFIDGEGAPELMKMEGGVHRVQRIPATEKGGRIHTSTVSVAVLPKPTEIDVAIPDRDIVIDTKRASGAGGQHVNTTDSAVRITHTPTGTVVECQEGRSQIKNKEIALQKLRTLLWEKQHQEQLAKINDERKSQVGSSNRNEKIRTYNYPQDRVTEHREGGGTIHNIQGFMEGEHLLEQMQLNLLRQYTRQDFFRLVRQFAEKQEKEKEKESENVKQEETVKQDASVKQNENVKESETGEEKAAAATKN